ncbi:NADP-dependent oxidoreductase [Streptomyces wuyuanensis]|uniref:NADP-dependent oxidoreductase n=1 Tax=Streptomyces wuyuanensis TaxID=1196353 RepID=UPI003412FDC3
MPVTSRYITVHAYIPDRAPTAQDFTMETRAVPEPREGQVLIEPVTFSVDPSTRNQLTGRPYFLPQVPLGAPISGPALGRIVASRHPDHHEADLVTGLMQWGDHSLWQEGDPGDFLKGLTTVDETLDKPTHMLGVYGIAGLTAYYGITQVARLQPGETIVVSSAAGAVGALAGQIAKIHGARVIGLTSSRAKRDLLTGHLGFDHALDYRANDFADRLRTLLPGGPDVYFDNVGGDLSQTVMSQMRRPARVVECGQIATYNDPDAAWKVNIAPIHINGLRFEGYTPLLFAHLDTQARRQLRHWVDTGQLDPMETELEGLDRLPHALSRLFTGINTGKILVTNG